MPNVIRSIRSGVGFWSDAGRSPPAGWCCRHAGGEVRVARVAIRTNRPGGELATADRFVAVRDSAGGCGSKSWSFWGVHPSRPCGGLPDRRGSSTVRRPCLSGRVGRGEQAGQVSTGLMTGRVSGVTWRMPAGPGHPGSASATPSSRSGIRPARRRLLRRTGPERTPGTGRTSPRQAPVAGRRPRCRSGR